MQKFLPVSILLSFTLAMNGIKFLVDAYDASKQVQLIALLGIMVLFSAAYVALMFQHRQRKPSSQPFFFAGLVFFCCIITPTFLETDHFRYILDGLAAAKGVNPYSLNPVDMQQQLGLGFFWLKNINHPEYHTIYPPLAQVLFQFSSTLNPFFWNEIFGPGIGFSKVEESIFRFFAAELGLKVLFGGVSALLVFQLHKSRYELLVLHPLFLVHVISNAHVDALYLPALLAITRNTGLKWNHLFQVFSWVAAVLIKWLPLAFFPLVFIRAVFLRGLWRSVFGFALAAAAGVVLCLCYSMGSNGKFLSSLIAYGNHWSFFGYGHWLFASVLRVLNVTSDPIWLAKLFSIGCFFLCLCSVCWLYLKAFVSFRLGLSWCAVALFVFFPTLHPWYLLSVLVLGLPYLKIFPIFWLWPVLSLASHAHYLSDRTPVALQLGVYLIVSIVLAKDLRSLARRVHFEKPFQASPLRRSHLKTKESAS